MGSISFPGELLVLVFEYLSAEDLLNCSLVSRKWYQFAFHPALWKNLALTKWNMWKEKPQEPNDWFATYKKRSSQDKELFKLIRNMISPKSRDNAMHQLLHYGEDVFEALQNLIEQLTRDQEIPEFVENPPAVPPYVKHISTLFSATSAFDLLHASCYENRYKELVHVEEDEKSLEHLAVILSEWGTRKDGSIISQQLDEIATSFRSHVIQTEGSNIEAFLSEQRDLFIVEKLLKYLTEQLGFSGAEADYYNPNNSFLHKLLETKQGIPITLSIFFRSIAQRIGINVHVLNSPRHVVIAYKPPGATPFVIIDVFNNQIMSLQQCNNFLSVDYSPQNLPIVSADELLYRMLNNLRQIYKSLADNKLIAVVSFMLLIKPQPNDYVLRILLNKSRGFVKLALNDFEKIKELNYFEPEELERFHAHILSDSDRPSVSTDGRKRSDEENQHVQFRVGHVFRHIRYGYRGVIIRWDPVCLSSTEWIRQMRIHSLPRSTQQPFYSVLVDSRDNHGQITYVAEDNIGDECHDVIHNPEIGIYFEEYDFRTHKYIPNDYWKTLFPED